MSMEAVGAYLRELRESRGKSAVAIAEAIGTSQTHIWRIEQGKTQSIRAEMLFSFVQSVSGSLDDVQNLLMNPAATSDDGKFLANRRRHTLVQENRMTYETMCSDNDVLKAIGYVLKIRHDHSRMERLLDFGRQLIEEEKP